jgi:hypothetical protein
VKFVEPSHLTDPDTAAPKLVEIATTTQSVQDGRLYIEVINGAFLEAGGSPVEFRAGIERAVDQRLLWRHESGTYVKSTPASATCSRRDVIYRLGNVLSHGLVHEPALLIS